MDKGRTQSFDKDDLLAEMEALIRNGVRIDVLQAVNKHLEEYEEMTPDEREFDLELWIEDARGLNPSYDSQVAWAFLKELSERILERDEMPPRRLAQFTMEVLTVPIRLLQTHTACRMLPLTIPRTQSTPSGCMREADRHGSNWPNSRKTDARSTTPK